MTNRFFIVPVAIAISAAFIGAAATPAMAAEGTCTTTPAQIRSLAASAPSVDNAKKALHLTTVGEQLCEQGARYEAGKKFSAAAKLLGTDMASLTAAPVAR
jgi:hypothetical protein